MKKKSRHRLSEMKENEAKRKIDEVDTITHSRSACDREDSGILSRTDTACCKVNTTIPASS